MAIVIRRGNKRAPNREETRKGSPKIAELRNPKAYRKRAAKLDKAIEELDDEIAPDDSFFPDPSIEEGPDPDDYDLGEYDLDGPKFDEDEQESGNVFFGPLDCPGPSMEPSAYPSLTIEPTGHVRIRAEERLQEMISRDKHLSQAVQMKIAASALLRQVAEYMVNQWRDLILNPDKTIDDLPPVSQFEMAKALGIAEDSRMSRLVNRYVSTPYWGILHMTKFFRAEEEKEECWREAMSHALQRIESEYPRSPVKTATLWKEVKAILEKGGVGNLKSDRMLRNRLEAKGIPSAPARKEIFKKVEKWFKEDEGHPDLERLTCSGIRKILMERHNLFSSSDSNRFRETGYTPFVEERIKKVVQILSERETRNGRDIKRKAKDIC